MSDQGGVEFGACVAKLECVRLDDDAAFDECWDTAKERTPVTRRTRSFCQIYTASVFECGYTYSVVECERDYRMWGNDVLDLMIDCSRIDGCAYRDMCQDMVFQ